ncbi:MAG: nitroreductase family protein [Promethearchaeota archaeon]|jgi:nitroreductase
MDFYDVVKNRRSYRMFKPDMPEKEKVDKILNAARLAPTWANAQAPMFIVGIIHERGSGMNSNREKYYGVDIGICFEHLILAATAEGLATCWIGWFNEEKMKKTLDIPDEYKVMGITPLGYSLKSKGEVTERKPLNEIVHYEKF